MLTPEKPPIAEHPVWSTLTFRLQLDSLNKRRFPLSCPVPDGVIVPCVCGEPFNPFRAGSMFMTAPGHRSCASTPTARHYALWCKVAIKKLTGVTVQGGLYD